MSEPIKVLGCDISLNHGAIVELTDGSLTNFWYYTDYAGSAQKSQRGFRVPPELLKIKDKQLRAMQRLVWIENVIDKKVLMKSNPQYAGIEDYAFGAEHNAYQIGEVGGIVRILCWFRGINLRLHDPLSLKMFVAHDGTCQKDAVQRAVTDRWGPDFSSFDQPAAAPSARNPNPKQNRQTSQDLSDAYGIAKMVWTEVELRSGRVKMSDLHAKEVQVFNRITKPYPVSLLDRDWIANPDGTATPHGEPVCEKCGSRSCCLAKL